jgi:hypothetical protein
MKVDVINDEIRESQGAYTEPEGLHVLDLLIVFACRLRFIMSFKS